MSRNLAQQDNGNRVDTVFSNRPRPPAPLNVGSGDENEGDQLSADFFNSDDYDQEDYEKYLEEVRDRQLEEYEAQREEYEQQ